MLEPQDQHDDGEADDKIHGWFSKSKSLNCTLLQLFFPMYVTYSPFCRTFVLCQQEYSGQL